MVLVVMSFLLLYTVGGVLVRALGFPGMALGEVLLVLAPPLVWASLRGVRLGPALGLGLPPRPLRSLAGALLIGAGGFYLVAAGVEALQERVAPLPPALRDELRRIILPPSGPRPLLVDLITIALMPALCEEALFRGALLSALSPPGRGRGHASGAVAATALLFGFYHASLYRLLPTAALGVLLGVARVRTGSLWPSVVIHAVNNALVVLLVRAGFEDPPAVTSPLGIGLLAASVAGLIGGIWLLGTQKPAFKPT